MPDFITQEFFEPQGDQPSPAEELLPNDALGHDRLMKGLLESLFLIDPFRVQSGSVVALQASWGRGKTDLLARIARETYRDGLSRYLAPALWVNPWQYGSPDLLSPMVAQL
ncbi:MAG: hypothetical protein HYU66_14320 [Armatimonadetes bacterium]|nr:hypothetical protein [Armatimonadota bacterium]